MLANDGGDTDHALRFVQFDVSNSSAELDQCSTGGGCIFSLPPTTHPQGCPNGTPGGGSIRFWYFGDTPLCSSDSTSCGCGHFLEQRLDGARPKVISSTYYFTDPANLGENLNAQRVLPGDGTPLKIGEITVRLPAVDGTYTLDMMNAGQSNPDLGGADVRWGFGTNINGEPLTTWRAGSGLSGGTIDLTVGTGPSCPNFVSAAPACDASLSKLSTNVVRITYGGAIPDPTGCAGVEIVALDASGADAGPNLAGSFTCSADGPNTLRIEENGSVLANETWYRVTFCNTTVTYAAVKGNANQDGLTDFGDLSFMFANQTGSAADDDPNDVNSDGLVDFGDLSAAFSVNGSSKPARPAIAVCP